MIVDRVASSRPDLALDLMWRFMSLADSVFNRVDDSNGTVGDVFRSACDDLAKLASEAKPDPETLAARAFAAITDNGYGVFDDLVKIVFPALGETGVARLKSKLDAALAGCPARHDRRADCLRRALQDLASAEGNVDGYIALSLPMFANNPALPPGSDGSCSTPGAPPKPSSPSKTARRRSMALISTTISTILATRGRGSNGRTPISTPPDRRSGPN
jgi:hypothetical protein